MSMNTRTLRLVRITAGLSASFALLGMGTHAFASVLPVTSCADDNTAGTLRNVAANAASGDQIDLSQLSCANSTITLVQGEVVVAHNASLVGPANHSLTIVGDGMNRVLHGASSDDPAWLDIVNLNISGGRMYTKSVDAEGGCILAQGELTLTGAVIDDCVAGSIHAGARGGAISAQSVNMASSRVTNSTATTNGYYQVARGGGIYASTLTCTDSTLSGNSAYASTAWFDQGGGALIPGGDLDLNRCTVDSNVAGQGGGIMQFAFTGSQPLTTIRNSTISGNSATRSAAGGIEVFCPDCTPQPVALLNSTVAFNVSNGGYAGGIETNGVVIAQSSILANNMNSIAGSRGHGADLAATELQGANNLVMFTTTPYATGVVSTTANPQLLPLANNGGKTQTHALATTSPALNHGNNFEGFATDQRSTGFLRVVSGMTDIGAYQHQPTGTR